MDNVSSINVQSYQISPMPNEKRLGPQIRSLYKGNDFQNSINVVERNACTAFKNVIEKLLGNHKDEDYENIVRIMFKNFHILGCNMSLKGLYCLDLRLGVKDLFMHKKHSLRALNIKITIC
jgi:hypothetical protein